MSLSDNAPIRIQYHDLVSHIEPIRGMSSKNGDDAKLSYKAVRAKYAHEYNLSSNWIQAT
ncbi:hypothetical protein V2A60_006968 [Cordyceps javanica]